MDQGIKMPDFSDNSSLINTVILNLKKMKLEVFLYQFSIEILKLFSLKNNSSFTKEIELNLRPLNTTA